MLFPARLHDPIRRGELTVAFRRWRRPTVTEGGTLQSPAGLLRIDELIPISEHDVTESDARAAGSGSRDELLTSIGGDGDRTLYRIRFRRIGDDPRVSLRTDAQLDREDVAAIDDQLRRWDDASRTGPWTAALLDLIAARPATPSRTLAAIADTDQAVLKRRVRQLKGLGLTESLDTGYRLSPRAEAYLQHPDGAPDRRRRP